MFTFKFVPCIVGVCGGAEGGICSHYLLSQCTEWRLHFPHNEVRRRHCTSGVLMYGAWKFRNCSVWAKRHIYTCGNLLAPRQKGMYINK